MPRATFWKLLDLEVFRVEGGFLKRRWSIMLGLPWGGRSYGAWQTKDEAARALARVRRLLDERHTSEALYGRICAIVGPLVREAVGPEAMQAQAEENDRHAAECRARGL